MKLFAKPLLIISLHIILINIGLYGQSGNSVYTFMNSTNSGRVTALGSNFLPIDDNDISLVYANPSLINDTMHNNISIDYVDYISDINAGLITYAYNFNKVGTFAASLQFSNYGKFDMLDYTGQEMGEFTASDYALIIGWAKPLSDNITLGANIKNIFSFYESYNSYGLAADVALTYSATNKLFSSSFILKNMGRQITAYTGETTEDLPFNAQLGISKKFQHAPFRILVLIDNLQQWDLTYSAVNSDDEIDPFTGEEKETDELVDFGDKALRHLAMGVEFIPGKGNFMVRLGYNYRRQQEMKIASKAGLVGFSFGFGMKVKKFKISYTRANYHQAGGTNTISIGTNFDNLFTRAS